MWVNLCLMKRVKDICSLLTWREIIQVCLISDCTFKVDYSNKILVIIIITATTTYWVSIIAKWCLKCLTLYMLLNLFHTISPREKYNFCIHCTYKWDKEKLSKFPKIGPNWHSKAHSLTTEPELIISI